MNYTEHKLTLDIHKTVSAVALRVKKGDTGRRLLIHLAEKGYPYHISEDCYAVFTAKKPDGKVVFNDCSIEDCVILYDLTAQTVAAAGLMDCEIILYGSDGKQLTSASFNIIVEDTIYDSETEIESTDEYNALAELVAQVTEIKVRNLATPPIIDGAYGELISVFDASNSPLQGLRIFGKSIQEAEPTLDNPVDIVSIGAGGSVKAKVKGKNIVSDVVYAKFSTDYASLLMCNDTGAIEMGKIYTISVTLTADKETKAYWNNVSGFFAHELITVSAGTKRYSKTFTALVDGNIGTSRILLSKSSTGDGVTITPSDCQIERGSVATEYAHAEQSVVISTPNGLPGIPVSSGGNYTDANGQQWICDEVDLARGVYVRRIYTEVVKSEKIIRVDNDYASIGGAVAYFTLANKHSSNDNIRLVMCDKILGIAYNARGNPADIYRCYAPGSDISVVCFRYPISEGVKTIDEARSDFVGATVSYVLATPIETAIAEEELAAYAALHTYKPNTTIYNDAGAYMAAEYVADTKTYIDRKKAGSQAAIGEVTLLASKWVGTASPYSQVVQISGVTKNSQVDLTPSIEQLAIFHHKDLAFVTENVDGVVTVYALGDKPTNDYTIQVTITEVYL